MSLTDKIKAAATGINVKIQTAEEIELEKIFNQMFYLPKKIEEEVAFVKQVMTRGLESQERVGLHASSLISKPKDYCIRAQVLSLIYKQKQGEQHAPGLMRIFEEGNSVHEKWQRLFIRAGYAKAVDCDYTNYNDKLMVSFTPDAIINIPQFLNGEEIVVEIKSQSTFPFKKQTKHATASKQLQLYMRLKKKRYGIVLVEDKNTQDFRVEFYKYDKEISNPFIERAVEIQYHYEKLFNEKKMIKRPDECISPTCTICNKCAMKDACWNVGMGRIKIGSK